MVEEFVGRVQVGLGVKGRIDAGGTSSVNEERSKRCGICTLLQRCSQEVGLQTY